MRCERNKSCIICSNRDTSVGDSMGTALSRTGQLITLFKATSRLKVSKIYIFPDKQSRCSDALSTHVSPIQDEPLAVREFSIRVFNMASVMFAALHSQEIQAACPHGTIFMSSPGHIRLWKCPQQPGGFEEYPMAHDCMIPGYIHHNLTCSCFCFQDRS